MTMVLTVIIYSFLGVSFFQLIHDVHELWNRFHDFELMMETACWEGLHEYKHYSILPKLQKNVSTILNFSFYHRDEMVTGDKLEGCCFLFHFKKEVYI